MYTLEQLRKCRNLNNDYNEDDVVDMEDNNDDAFEVPDIENTAKKVVEEMTGAENFSLYSRNIGEPDGWHTNLLV